MLTPEIKASIDKSVLCWLATVSSDTMPNVSPKEAFTYYQEEYVIIANIASPQSVKNILQNPKVCVSFIDIFIQKGFQLKGNAQIIEESNPEFAQVSVPILAITQGKYPFKSVTKTKIEQIKPIIAPSYWLFPDTSDEERVQSVYKTYNLK